MCVSPRYRLKNVLNLFFYDLGGRAGHQTVFSVAACNSDSELLAAFQTVETTLVRPQRHRLDADKFPMLLLGVGPG